MDVSSVPSPPPLPKSSPLPDPVDPIPLFLLPPAMYPTKKLDQADNPKHGTTSS